MMNDMVKPLVITILLCVIPFVINLPFYEGHNTTSYFDFEFYAFSDPDCSTCVIALASLPGDPIMYDVREMEAGIRYSKIIELTNYTASALPLVGVMRNHKLVLIASGYFSSDDWKTILGAEYEGVPIYASRSIEPVKVINNEILIANLTKLFIEKDYENIFKNSSPILPIPIAAIITAALIDSINLCELYVLTVLLSLVFFKAGRSMVLKVGLIYALGVFLSYFLLGFGLIHLLAYSAIARYIIVIAGITVGLRTIINLAFGAFGISIGLREAISSMFGKKFKRVPDVVSTRLSSYLRKASSSPLTAFAIGILSGLLLSPCTSGPYFIALSLISSLQNPFTGLLLLITYNMIFILPMVILTLGIYTLKITTRTLKMISSQSHQKTLNLIIGLLMIFLSIYLLIAST